MNENRKVLNEIMDAPGFKEQFAADKKEAIELAAKWVADAKAGDVSFGVFGMALGKALAAVLQVDVPSGVDADKFISFGLGSFFRAVCCEIPALGVKSSSIEEEELTRALCIVSCTEPYDVQIKAAIAMISAGLQALAASEGCDIPEAIRRHNLPFDAFLLPTEKLH